MDNKDVLARVAVLEAQLVMESKARDQLRIDMRNLYRLVEEHMKQEEEDRKEILKMHDELNKSINSLVQANKSRAAFIAGVSITISGLWALVLSAVGAFKQFFD